MLPFTSKLAFVKIILVSFNLSKASKIFLKSFLGLLPATVSG